MSKKLKIFLLLLTFLAFTSIALLTYINSDSKYMMPVKNASRNDYSQKSLGAPRVGHKHHGADIFAKRGTPVLSATRGIVMYEGILKLGGKVVLVLGPYFKMYYYAHLDTIMTHRLSLLKAMEL